MLGMQGETGRQRTEQDSYLSHLSLPGCTPKRAISILKGKWYYTYNSEGLIKMH